MAHLTPKIAQKRHLKQMFWRQEAERDGEDERAPLLELEALVRTHSGQYLAEFRIEIIHPHHCEMP